MSLKSWDRYKRGFDLTVMVFGHLLLSPVFIVLWSVVPIWIWVEDRGPIFYSQNRVGRDGRVFRMLKFRSMVVDADQLGPVWTIHQDPRRTRIGRFLRQRGLDELPGLISVWRGDLSLVGPRPLNEQEHAKMTQEIREFNRRLSVRPGITGLAQVFNLSDDPNSKLDFDLNYIDTMSLILDVKLIAVSIWYSIFGKIDRRSARQPQIRFQPASSEIAPPRAIRDGYKRPFDLAVIVASLLIALPVWMMLWTLIPLSIWLADRGPIFYTQTRMGKNGLHFQILKFRTMIVDAEDTTGPIWSLKSDERITKVGRMLRRLRLDELPQVINVVRGEMSLVGPRPERPELVEEFYRDLPNFRQRLKVRPGIAGLAQVRGTYATLPKNKLRYDSLYMESFGFWLDLKLLVMSARIAISSDRR